MCPARYTSNHKHLLRCASSVLGTSLNHLFLHKYLSSYKLAWVLFFNDIYLNIIWSISSLELRRVCIREPTFTPVGLIAFVDQIYSPNTESAICWMIFKHLHLFHIPIYRLLHCPAPHNHQISHLFLSLRVAWFMGHGFSHDELDHDTTAQIFGVVPV